MTKRKRWPWVAGVIATVVVSGVLAINLILAPIAARKLKIAVNSGTHGKYTLQFERLRLNVFTGTASLKGVQLIRNRISADTEGIVFSGTTDQIEVSGVHILPFILKKKLEIGSITIANPALSITRRRQPLPEKTSPPLDQQMQSIARLIAVSRISLKNARLDFTDSVRKPARLQLQELDIEANDLLIEPGSSGDTSRTLFCKAITATLNHFSAYTHDRAYHYSLNSARFSTLNRRLTLKGMRLEPLAPKAFFAKMPTDRFEFSLDSLAVEQFNYRSFLDQDLLLASRISGFRGRLDVFGNPNGRVKPGDRVAGFPQVILGRMPTRIAADTLDLADIDISYREINKTNRQTGRVSFQQTKARFLDITNVPERVKTHPWCSLKLHTLLMGTGALSAAVDFKLSDPMVKYTIRGDMRTMSATAVNPVTVPLALARIKSGTVDRLDFAIRADRNRSIGTMHLLYRDLSIEMLRPDDHQKLLQTLLVNTLVIGHNNPDEAGKPARFAKIVYLRPKSYPFFKTIWNTLFNGFKSCAGAAPAVQPQPKESLTQKIGKVMGRLFKRARKQKQKADQSATHS